MSEPEVLKSNKMDPKFKYEISKLSGAGQIMLCFQCGTCTADCPIAKFSKLYRPRRIARMVQFGLKEKLLSSDHLWLCSTCFTCIDHCPQKVEIASIIRVLRNMIVREKGMMPMVFKGLLSNLLKTGYVYVIPEFRLQKRVEEGLPPLPKANLEDLSRIFNATGSASILENAKSFDKVKI